VTLTSELKQVVIEKLDHGENYRQISKETGVSLGAISKLGKCRVEQLSLIEQPVETTSEDMDTTINPLQEVKIGQVQSDIDELVKTKQALEAEKLQLQTQVEEARRTLDVEKKTAEDFQSIKKEISDCGIDITDSTRFLAVVNSFKKYNYDCGKIMLAFADIRDIESEKKHLEQLKEEADKNENVVKAMIGTLGIGIDDLKKAIVSLMTLEDYGVGVEEILKLVRERNLRGTENISMNQYGSGRRY
jgi:hypothetical protein